MSSRQLTEWMAYFAGKQRMYDILQDGQGQVDADTAWALVWGAPDQGVASGEDA